MVYATKAARDSIRSSSQSTHEKVSEPSLPVAAPMSQDLGGFDQRLRRSAER
jgi:hypothetical protein